MNRNDVERALGLDAPNQERVIDAEVVSPKRIKAITTFSMIISMSAVAAAAWFAGSSMNQVHVDPVLLPDDLLRIADLEAFASTVEEREETYRVLFEGVMDRLEFMENRAHKAERAIAALLPMIGATIAGASPEEPVAGTAPSTKPVREAPVTAAIPTAAQAAKPKNPPTQDRAKPTPAPVVSPVAPITLPEPVARTQPSQPFDETALPFAVVDLESKGIRLVSDAELLDAAGKPVGIGSVISGLEGRLLRVSASEQLIVTDKKIYVIE